MEKEIIFSEEELRLLQEFVEGYLDEISPTPTKAMRSLALKLQLSSQTMNWIERMLESQ